MNLKPLNAGRLLCEHQQIPGVGPPSGVCITAWSWCSCCCDERSEVVTVLGAGRGRTAAVLSSGLTLTLETRLSLQLAGHHTSPADRGGRTTDTGRAGLDCATLTGSQHLHHCPQYITYSISQSVSVIITTSHLSLELSPGYVAILEQ